MIFPLLVWLAVFWVPLQPVIAAPAVSPVVAVAPSVNLNSADAATLARDLIGVGPAKAKAIVDYRMKNGPFRSIDDLALVKGIGQRLIERNRARLRLNAANAATPTRGR